MLFVLITIAVISIFAIVAAVDLRIEEARIKKEQAVMTACIQAGKHFGHHFFSRDIFCK